MIESTTLNLCALPSSALLRYIRPKSADRYEPSLGRCPDLAGSALTQSTCSRSGPMTLGRALRVRRWKASHLALMYILSHVLAAALTRCERHSGEPSGAFGKWALAACLDGTNLFPSASAVARRHYKQGISDRQCIRAILYEHTKQKFASCDAVMRASNVPALDCSSSSLAFDVLMHMRLVSGGALASSSRLGQAMMCLLGALSAACFYCCVCSVQVGSNRYLKMSCA